jgi:hypothetical protein
MPPPPVGGRRRHTSSVLEGVTCSICPHRVRPVPDARRPAAALRGDFQTFPWLDVVGGRGCGALFYKSAHPTIGPTCDRTSSSTWRHLSSLSIPCISLHIASHSGVRSFSRGYIVAASTLIVPPAFLSRASQSSASVNIAGLPSGTRAPPAMPASLPCCNRVACSCRYRVETRGNACHGLSQHDATRCIGFTQKVAYFRQYRQ